ncbi:phosphatidate cytidylyltransferase [Candidatus Babeliales bacterium]|nr:phosphatidate cytidylyltransferase [Candidatus Babeliales bacterium]
MMISTVSEFIKRLFTSVLLVGCLGGAYLHSFWLYAFALLAVLLLVLFFEWPRLIDADKFWFWPLTVLYPIMPFVLLIMLAYAYREADPLLPLVPIALAWAADTFGYFVGKCMGRHKVCPSISPGKSWEGLLGSFVGVWALLFVMVPQVKTLAGWFATLHWAAMPGFAFTTTVIAFLGGIFISYFKRRKNLKDAGSLLPGHGGLLDRFDSVLFVTLMLSALLIFLRYSQGTLGSIFDHLPEHVSQQVQQLSSLPSSRPASVPVEVDPEKNQVVRHAFDDEFDDWPGLRGAAFAQRYESESDDE